MNHKDFITANFQIVDTMSQNIESVEGGRKESPYPAGRASVSHGAMSQVQLISTLYGVLDSKPHDMGEGLGYRINRRELKPLFKNFPNAPDEQELFEHVKGKTVVAWGAGDVGKGTATIARQMGANVVFIDINDDVLATRRNEFGEDGVTYINSNEGGAQDRINEILSSKDTIGVALGALVKGGRAPTLLTQDRLASINQARTDVGANALVIADAQIDQGGGVEGITATNHNQPFVCICGSPGYAVANVPGSIYTAGYASQQLEAATLEDTIRLIKARSQGTHILDEDPLIKTALNTWGGKVTDKAVAGYFERTHVSPDDAIGQVPYTAQDGKIILGVAAEIKDFENRIALTPAGVKKVVDQAKADGIDLELWIERGGGKGAGHNDEDYIAMGAKIKERDDILRNADILKGVKEPMGDELTKIKDDAWVYTYFHYTGMSDDKMLKWAETKNIASFAYETRLGADGHLPQLKCMSDVDGRANMFYIAAASNPRFMKFGKATDLFAEYDRGMEAERLREMQQDKK